MDEKDYKFGDEVYISIFHYPVYALGVGNRIGIWFQGCNKRCKGCITRFSWRTSRANKIKVDKLVGEIAKYLKEDPEGVTISGGEPFDQPEALDNLLTKLREIGIKDILVYTGFYYDEIKEKYKDILEKIDALVDGPYQKGNTTKYIWKGSENQEMHILTKNEVLGKKYSEYKKIQVEKRRLQITELKGKLYILGIPDQKDEEVLINGI